MQEQDPHPSPSLSPRSAHTPTLVFLVCPPGSGRESHQDGCETGRPHAPLSWDGKWLDVVVEPHEEHQAGFVSCCLLRQRRQVRGWSTVGSYRDPRAAPASGSPLHGGAHELSGGEFSPPHLPTSEPRMESRVQRLTRDRPDRLLLFTVSHTVARLVVLPVRWLC